VHLELAGGRRGIDAFGETDERHAGRPQFIEQRDQVPEVSADAPFDCHILGLRPGARPFKVNLTMPSPCILIASWEILS